MIDANLSLQPWVTKTASFQGTPLILPGGTSRRGLKARFLYSAAANASGANAVIFAVYVSKDGGVTFNIEGQTDPINLSTTAQSGEIHVPFEVSPTSVANGIQIEAGVLISGAGTVPTVTYQSDITLGRPG